MKIKYIYSLLIASIFGGAGIALYFFLQPQYTYNQKEKTGYLKKFFDSAKDLNIPHIENLKNLSKEDVQNIPFIDNELWKVASFSIDKENIVFDKSFQETNNSNVSWNCLIETEVGTFSTNKNYVSCRFYAATKTNNSCESIFDLKPFSFSNVFNNKQLPEKIIIFLNGYDGHLIPKEKLKKITLQKNQKNFFSLDAKKLKEEKKCTAVRGYSGLYSKSFLVKLISKQPSTKIEHAMYRHRTKKLFNCEFENKNHVFFPKNTTCDFFSLDHLEEYKKNKILHFFDQDKNHEKLKLINNTSKFFENNNNYFVIKVRSSNQYLNPDKIKMNIDNLNLEFKNLFDISSRVYEAVKDKVKFILAKITDDLTNSNITIDPNKKSKCKYIDGKKVYYHVGYIKDTPPKINDCEIYKFNEETKNLKDLSIEKTPTLIQQNEIKDVLKKDYFYIVKFKNFVDFQSRIPEHNFELIDENQSTIKKLRYVASLVGDLEEEKLDKDVIFLSR